MPVVTVGQSVGQAGDMQFGVQPDSFNKDDLQKAVDDMMTTTATGKPADPSLTGSNPGGKAGEILDLARTQLGVNYVYGAHKWGQALDCSGLTQEVFRRAGINIGGDTYSQVQQGQAVSDISQARPGDLVFMVGDVGMKANGHVGIYIGNGQMIAAPHTGAQVRIQAVGNNITAIRRYF